MTERTAEEIRAYLTAARYGYAIAKTPAKRRAYCTSLGHEAMIDLPRLLDAAQSLWRARYADREMMLRQRAARLVESEGMMFSEEAIRDAVLNDGLLSRFAWLEELSPEPAISPDGENEEGNEYA